MDRPDITGIAQMFLRREYLLPSGYISDMWRLKLVRNFCGQFSKSFLGIVFFNDLKY